MKPIQITVLGVTTAAGLGLCIVLWRFAWLADRTLIVLFVAGVVVLLCAGYFLLSMLQQSGRAIRRLAIESAQLKDQVKVLLTQAHYDHLTGLGNRNLLADRFQFAMERSMRGKESFALLMVDLNNFKSINDNYGHSAGDEVLVASARRLLAAVRASDTVVRLGGDEFLLLIERFGKCNDVFNLGQKLIDSLSEEIALSSGDIVSVGASVGIAQFPKDGFDIGGLIEYADQSMYECKTSGRMPLEFG